MRAPLLSVRALSARFGGIRALEDLALDVFPDEILALIGPNGAGKTTLFNCLTGIVQPGSGDIALAGESLRGKRPDERARKGLARTFQNIELFRSSTTLDNVLLGRHCHLRYGAFGSALRSAAMVREERSARRRADELLELLGLASARERVVAELPYGTQKRVELARALALEPKILLLDEPSAGMNAEEKEELTELLRGLREKLGVAMILVEHDMKLVMRISDRVVVLDGGRKIADGSPSEVSRDPKVLEAYLGTTES